MLRIIAATAIVLTAAAPGSAQDVRGEITATLDGEERQWFVTGTNLVSQSTWSGNVSYAKVELYGHASDETITDAGEALQINFGVLTQDDGSASSELPEMTYLADGMGESYVANSDTGADVRVESIEIDGSQLSISGTFEASLAFTGDLGQTIDQSRTKPIRGRFDAEIKGM